MIYGMPLAPNLSVLQVVRRNLRLRSFGSNWQLIRAVSNQRAFSTIGIPSIVKRYSVPLDQSLFFEI